MPRYEWETVGTKAESAELLVINSRVRKVVVLFCFVSPLATLALGLCVVGDTGMKTGWVICRRGAGWAGGWGGEGWGEGGRGGTMVQMLFFGPVNSVLSV